MKGSIHSLVRALVVALLAPFCVANAQDSAERVGADGAKRIHITLRDAVTMALENNREIEIERLNVRKNEFDLTAARGAYDPSLATTLYYDRRTIPVASLLAGGGEAELKTSDLVGGARLSQRLPWQGASIEARFDQSRATSGNLFNSLNPQFATSLSVELTQPLWRNRRIDAERRAVRIAQQRLDLSDSQFRGRAIEIIAGVERAYWDLVFARRDEEIKRESVELARVQLARNQRAVEEGALAPADVISARVEVERRTDEAEAAREATERAENALKALLFAPDEVWSATITPVEQPKLDSTAALTFEDAMKLALNNRPEMEQFRLQGELSRVDVDYFRNQTKPQIDFVAGYGRFGLAGKERTTLNPISESQLALFARVNDLSGLAGLPQLAPFPSTAVLEKFIGGYGSSLGNLFSQNYQAFRVGVSINLSLRNRAAKAQLGRALVESLQIEAQRERAVRQIEVEVRNALQAVESSRRRVTAAKSSRESAEQQYSSEQRKFEAGQSTNYFVLDRQNALSAARGRELKALTDYTKAVSELQRALSLTLANNNVMVSSR